MRTLRTNALAAASTLLLATGALAEEAPVTEAPQAAEAAEAAEAAPAEAAPAPAQPEAAPATPKAWGCGRSCKGNWDTTPPPANAVTLNVVSAVNGGLQVDYERAVSRHVGLVVEGSAYQSERSVRRGSSPLGASFVYASPQEELHTQSVGAGVGARLYLCQAPRGLFLFPEVRVARQEVERNGVSVTGIPIGVGASAGYTLLLFRHLDLSVGFGAQAVFNQVVLPGMATPSRFQALPRANLGVAF